MQQHKHLHFIYISIDKILAELVLPIRKSLIEAPGIMKAANPRVSSGKGVVITLQVLRIRSHHQMLAKQSHIICVSKTTSCMFYLS